MDKKKKMRRRRRIKIMGIFGILVKNTRKMMTIIEITQVAQR